jgi:amidase
MTDLHFQSATRLADAVRRKEIASLELTDLFIERIEKHDEALNAVVVRCFDEAREAARAADEALSRGDSLGPLHGLPVTIKEAYDLKGTATTFGMPPFRDNVAASDAATVRRLKAAGAHFMGKTNVPLSLADFQSFNDIYGTTNNPWNTGRTPGGSSGGSAAALAAGLTALEAGSDIGGSIRNPAHFCGVYGHKPTWGVVSGEGHALPGLLSPADIAVVGPMARSAPDLALAMEIVAGADAFSKEGWTLQLPRPEKASLEEFRVAVWPNDDFAPVSLEVADRAQKLTDTLAGLGATVSDKARPRFADFGLSFEDTLETYQSLLWGVMSAGLPEEIHEALKAEAETLAEDDRSIHADYLRGSTQDHRRWGFHNNRRFLIRRVWSAFFQDWDILICPQVPTVAFPHDHGSYFERTLSFDGRTIDYMSQINWAGLITVAHLPSTVFPTGPSRDGLPIGLQAVGREFDDYRTIDFCRLLAEEIGGFEAPPGFE